MDERKESGEYYPGGGQAQSGGGSGGGGGDATPMVPVTHVEGLPENYRESDMRSKINQLCRIVSGGVAALAAMVAIGNERISIEGARKNELWNWEFVVTNVTAELDDLATTNDVEDARSAEAAARDAAIAEATNDLAVAVGGSIATATNNLAEKAAADVAAATNAAERATDAKLTGYATRAWVEGQGYSNGSNMTAYAEKSWVEEQGFATESWVEGRGYIGAGELDGYATKEWVGGRGFLTEHQPLTNCATRAEMEGLREEIPNLAGYATEEWVEGRDYIERDEARDEIRREVQEAVAQTDENAAYRLVSPDRMQWIDGTGTVWRVLTAAEWSGNVVYGEVGAREWQGDGWSLEYESYGLAPTGTWRLVQGIADDIAVTFERAGLAYADGAYELRAAKVEVGGNEVTPGQITDDGWYEINDGEGGVFYVSPLVTTATVSRVTNAVDRVAKESELPPRTSLEPATNYTDSALGSFAATGKVEHAEWADVANSAGYADAAYGLSDGADVNLSTTEIKERLDSIPGPGITTNDVCAIVTNETAAGWTYPDLPEGYIITQMQWDEISYVWVAGAERLSDGLWFEGDAESPEGAAARVIHFDILDGETGDNRLRFTAVYVDGGNALGLARLSDIPTNHVTQAEMDAAIAGIDIPDISGLATKGQLAAVSNDAQIIYRLFSGSNVVDEVTNYNSTVRLPSRRLYQLDTNGYHMVWNEMDQHTNTLAKAKAYAADLGTNYAPRAWSRTTAMYGAEAPSNTTWISTPTTVIAAGYEYEKFATSGGAIWVLTSRGATYDFSPNTNNTAFLNIAAQDGTPIFRIEKTDSYLLGVNASAIDVQDDVMFVDVNIAAASHPFVRVCAQLGDTWQKEEDGISASLATVNWTTTANGYRCAVANNTGGSSLFAYFEYLQEGGVKIVNGGVLDISGGLIVNGTTYTRIGTANISGHTVLTLEQ